MVIANENIPDPPEKPPEPDRRTFFLQNPTDGTSEFWIPEAEARRVLDHYSPLRRVGLRVPAGGLPRPLSSLRLRLGRYTSGFG